jgi:iron complex transport system substrate-binding protein
VRRPRPLLAAIVAAVALAGCSPDNNAVEDGRRKPLKVAHALGETRVPYHGERPVALDPSALETALAVGVRPAGATVWPPGRRPPAYLRGAARGVDTVGTVSRPDLDAVTELEPDVIIASKRYQRRLYPRLERIAPTVMGGVPISQWKSDVRFHGEALGRSDRAEALLTDYDRRAARVRRALDRAGARSARLPGSLAGALSPAFAAGVMRDVGLRPRAVTVEGRYGGILAARALLRALARGAES